MNQEQQPPISNEQVSPVLKSDWRNYFTTVTPLSKALAMLLFIALPFVGFWLGMNYSSMSNTVKEDEPKSDSNFKDAQSPLERTFANAELMRSGDSVELRDKNGTPLFRFKTQEDEDLIPAYFDSQTNLLYYIDENGSLIQVDIVTNELGIIKEKIISYPSPDPSQVKTRLLFDQIMMPAPTGKYLILDDREGTVHVLRLSDNTIATLSFGIEGLFYDYAMHPSKDLFVQYGKYESMYFNARGMRLFSLDRLFFGSTTDQSAAIVFSSQDIHEHLKYLTAFYVENVRFVPESNLLIIDLEERDGVNGKSSRFQVVVTEDGEVITPTSEQVRQQIDYDISKCYPFGCG